MSDPPATDTLKLVSTVARFDGRAAAGNFAGRLVSEEGREGLVPFQVKAKPAWAREPSA